MSRFYECVPTFTFRVVGRGRRHMGGNIRRVMTCNSQTFLVTKNEENCFIRDFCSYYAKATIRYMTAVFLH